MCGEVRVRLCGGEGAEGRGGGGEGHGWVREGVIVVRWTAAGRSGDGYVSARVSGRVLAL